MAPVDPQALILADARRIPLKDGCVQCVVTSPPYFGLRDYNVAHQIGLEPSPDAYVASLVGAFRELRRVLADDGVCWLNLGDSYAGSYSGTSIRPEGGSQRDGAPGFQSKMAGRGMYASRNGLVPAGLKPKDLIGIPWRVAFALQADGWYLRSDIIWSKPNPMPESVTDRPTKSHEYVFLLTKSERYFYDADAIKNPPAASTLREVSDGYDGEATKDYESVGVQNPSSVKARIIAGKRDKQRGHGRRHAGFNARWDDMPKAEQIALGSNARSVWSIATMPYAGAHFATMPEKLAERCILAGSSPGDLVFDPFGGSGTTVRVARRFNRRGVMLDLNPAYLELAKQRNANLQPSILDLVDEASA